MSPLISELRFGSAPHYSHAKMAILAGSIIAALLATVVLRSHNRHYRRLAKLEARDDNGDGIPEVYQQD
ncbi:hypothetical protein [Arthrobacter sp. TWP1-1]|uniref:hypothetical protein n=1 Tax=Arthrobacter sp. TWP1-1 TaxID=2804568 RepID=UPI003CFB218D